MADGELVQHVVPAGLLEDGQMAEVVLQPPGLQLQERKRNRR